MSYVLIPRKLYEKLHKIKLESKGIESAIEFYLMYITKLNRELRLSDDDILKEKINLKYLRNYYTPIHSDDLGEINSEYNEMFMSRMYSEGIIEKIPYYNPAYGGFKGDDVPEVGEPFKYKIRLDLLDFSEIVNVQISGSDFLNTGKYLKRELSYLQQLDFDFNKMIKKIENLNPEDYLNKNPKMIFEKEKITVEAEGVKYLDGDEIDEYRMDGYELFEFKNKMYLALKDHFLERKNLEMKLSYCASVCMLMNGQFFAKKSKNNGRLTTSLTNLSKIFFKDDCVTLGGESLLENDLKNSQPCLFAYVLEDLNRIDDLLPNNKYKIPKVLLGEDSYIFMEQVWNGTFYDDIANKLNILRDKVKGEMFGVFFASNRDTKNEFKKLMREVYPTLMLWVSEFKRLNGSKNFSIMLQRIEAEIFLKKTLPKIRRNGIIVYTKHDSFLCKKSDFVKTRKIIETSFDNLGLKYQLAS
jgi:hypothetical protein